MGFNSGLKGLIQMSSSGRAQSCSKHVEDSDKHIIEEIVRQAGYLPELYEDARSEKYKTKQNKETRKNCYRWGQFAH
jgi:AAA+ ATPase superfamily predicted ATPase